MATKGYLFTAIEFPPSDSGPYTCTQKTRTVTYVRRKNTGHRTYKIERKKRTKQRNNIEKDNNNFKNRLSVTKDEGHRKKKTQSKEKYAPERHTVQ